MEPNGHVCLCVAYLLTLAGSRWRSCIAFYRPCIIIMMGSIRRSRDLIRRYRVWRCQRVHRSMLAVLIWDFQYDSYLSVSCRFGLLGYCWVRNSTWLAFLMVDCTNYSCALSLGSSLFFSEVSRARVLFSEVLRTISLLGGLTH